MLFSRTHRKKNPFLLSSSQQTVEHLFWLSSWVESIWTHHHFNTTTAEQGWWDVHWNERNPLRVFRLRFNFHAISGSHNILYLPLYLAKYLKCLKVFSQTPLLQLLPYLSMSIGPYPPLYISTLYVSFSFFNTLLRGTPYHPRLCVLLP